MNKTIIKEKTKDLFEKSGVAFAGLFGSFARGEEHEESDVDIMVKFNDHQEVSLLDFFALQNSLEDILGKKVDLTAQNSLNPRLKLKIISDLQTIYGTR